LAAEVESVSLDTFALEWELELVEDAFARAGFTVEARANIERRSSFEWGAATLPWLVYVVLAVPVSAFFAGFGHAAGRDAWDAVKQWVRDIWEAHEEGRYSGGVFELRDPSGTRVVLSPRLPDEALDALADVDWESVEGGDNLRWDTDRGEWRPSD
jgi:hypothetical protein